jgi:hypothetical protein
MERDENHAVPRELLYMMPSVRGLKSWICLGSLCLLGCIELAAQPTQSVDGVVFKGGTLLVVKAGEATVATNETILPNGIKISTNGTYRVQKGKERHLTERQALGADGLLTSPDGTLQPVYDHIAVVKGQPTLFKDGEPTALVNNTELPDGRRIDAEGYLVSKTGLRRKLLDGETFDLAGKSVPISDTVVLKGGKVLVQKDGASIEVPAGRSLMMNDGTKVFGDGRMVLRDGTTTNLAPEEVVKIQGVAPKAQ